MTNHEADLADQTQIETLWRSLGRIATPVGPYNVQWFYREPIVASLVPDSVLRHVPRRWRPKDGLAIVQSSLFHTLDTPRARPADASLTFELRPPAPSSGRPQSAYLEYWLSRPKDPDEPLVICRDPYNEGLASSRAMRQPNVASNEIDDLIELVVTLP